MEESFIIEIIEDYRRNYSNGDGGNEFIQQLANKLLNTTDEDKKEVINFLLNEIRKNKNGLGSVAIEVIVEMKAIELAPCIEKIYNDIALSMNDEWKYSIINSLMILQYKTPKTLYFEFVKYYFNKYPNNSFSLLLNYCEINSSQSLIFLSDYFVIFSRNDKRTNSIVEIGFLFHAFFKSSINNLYDLFKIVISNDFKTALWLKNQLFNYLNSDMATQYPINIKNNVKEKIDMIFFK